MDTPERNNQIPPSISKFEESPVFNFLNNLSPIKPVKSIHISQSFNSLSFASLPSIFTSPHVSSIKESKFLKRHQFNDPSQPEFSYENGKKDSTIEGMDVSHDSAAQKENHDTGKSGGESSVGPSNECLKPVAEISQTLSYDCGSPNCDQTTSCNAETKFMSRSVGASGSVVPFVQEVSERGLFGTQVHTEGISQSDQIKEPAESEWDSLISDAADLLIFESPNDSDAFKRPAQKSQDPGGEMSSTSLHNRQTTQTASASRSSEQNKSEKVLIESGDVSDVKLIGETQGTLAGSSLNDCLGAQSYEKLNDEPFSILQRGGMRRRCLVFEMVGARRKHFTDTSTCSSSLLSQSDGNDAGINKQLLPLNSGNVSSRRILPGIGLHLNALATTSKDSKAVKHDTLGAGMQLFNIPGSATSFHSSTGQESLNESLAGTSLEREIGSENGYSVDDVSLGSGYVPNEEFNQNSPKKKRRRLENGESEACKRCNCKKSKCLKLYCECFAAGVYCVEPCACQDCFNKPIHEDTVLATRKQIESRNPLAFAPKVIRSSDSVPEIGDESSKTPASARHKRGCNCKKSGCLKKYCECYQGGVGCSINCRCEGCKNAFGRKDGSAFVEAEFEDDETETMERCLVDKNVNRNVLINDPEHNSESALPATPLPFSRPSVQLPYSSKNKPPRSSLHIGSSSGSYTSQRFGKSNFFQSHSKFEKQLQQPSQQEELPEILLGNCSPISGIKSSSPNGKRVSPPHCETMGMSPGRRSTRKLILQSIPSFPSLTPKH